MPCPIRFGPDPRMTTFGRRTAGPRSRPRRSSSGTASRRRTPRRTCRPSCRSARRRSSSGAGGRRPRRPPEVGELGVGEPEPLGPPQPRRSTASSRPRQGLPLLDDHRHLVEEPRVDPWPRDRSIEIAATQRSPTWKIRSGVAIARRRAAPRRRGRRTGFGRVAVEPEPALLERPQRLLQALGERPPDRHHLADRLHLRAEHAGRAGQLLERPPRDLGDDVVDHRLEAGRCDAW